MTRLQRIVLAVLIAPIAPSLLIVFGVLSFGGYITSTAFIFIAGAIYVYGVVHAMTFGLFIFYHLEHYRILNILTCAIGGIITSLALPAFSLLIAALTKPFEDVFAATLFIGMFAAIPGLLGGVTAWTLWRFLPQKPKAKSPAA